MVKHDADFETFLRRWYVLPYDTWTSLDHRRLDMVMRTETLADDFATALQRIGAVSPGISVGASTRVIAVASREDA